MSRTIKTAIAIGAAVVVVGFFFIYSNPFSLMTSGITPASSTSGNNGLVVQDEVVGTGAVAQNGDTLTVNYTGKLQDGTVFDTSVGKAPFTFTLGAGQVIPGWDLGLQGMKVGGKRTLVIPPDMAYGAQGVGPIPPNATLTFEVELLNVAPAH
ncbi:MAG: FKBP-type peptidyl-prolyl cis-trans isomerase [Patescibacteria group bacterium]|nr:FKBP-type peptidyl-prolyl cis-trans isomerase [Patescibacteria group bacterium]